MTTPSKDALTAGTTFVLLIYGSLRGRANLGDKGQGLASAASEGEPGCTGQLEPEAESPAQPPDSALLGCPGQAVGWW